MGRVVTKSNHQSTNRTSVLHKTTDGGILKQLTAAEKRKRMIEAGTKYATLNRKIKAECSKAHFMKFRVKMMSGSTSKTETRTKSFAPLKSQNISPRRNKQIAETHNSQKSIPETILNNHSDVKCKSKSHFVKACLKPANEIFERDDAALTSILNKCPQNSICGRASIFRGRERPSLFPNGINPLDRAAEKFAKPLPLTTLAARSFSLGPIASTKVVTTSILMTPSSAFKMPKRTPAKTVRFEESIESRSRKLDNMSSPETYVPIIDKSLKATNEMILDLKVEFDDMLEKLRNLPAHVFSYLEKAVDQVASEKLRNANTTCSIFNDSASNTQLNSTAMSFTKPETKEVLPSCSCLSGDCIASRTRRKVRTSQVYVD